MASWVRILKMRILEACGGRRGWKGWTWYRHQHRRKTVKSERIPKLPTMGVGGAQLDQTQKKGALDQKKRGYVSIAEKKQGTEKASRKTCAGGNGRETKMSSLTRVDSMSSRCVSPTFS